MNWRIGKGGAGFSRPLEVRRCHGSQNRRNRLFHLSAVILALVLLTACHKPSHVTSSIEFKRKPGDVILVTLKIKNLDDRATTPIVPDLTMQTQTDGKWDKPASIIHPSGFVLARYEERDITAPVRTTASTARLMLTIKEVETGLILRNERFERTLPATLQR